MSFAHRLLFEVFLGGYETVSSEISAYYTLSQPTGTSTGRLFRTDASCVAVTKFRSENIMPVTDHPLSALLASGWTQPLTILARRAAPQHVLCAAPLAVKA